MKRREIEETIYTINYGYEDAPLKVKDLPKDIQPEDKIYCISDPGYYSDNNSWDPYTQYNITRMRPQTDEEYQAEVDFWEKKKEESRVARYKEYLRLKQEVEEGKLTRWNFEMSEDQIKEFEEYSNRRFL